MKATEILEKLQNVFLSTEAEVSETPIEEVKEELSSEEVVENVELEAQEEVSEEVVEETTELAEEEEVVEEEVVEEEAAAPEYATKEDLSKMKQEFMDVIESLVKKEEEYQKEVPAELSSDVDLSEEAEEISHSPESGVESKARFVIGGNRPMTTKDRVFNKMFNN
jgi:hypothetical protein